MRNELNRNQEVYQILKMVAPGTELREGLDNILKARTGALIVIGDSQEVMKLADGGFKIDEDYSPAKIYELAKMDGAIILSKDAKKILLANAQLIPDASIVTIETGTRHRTAERMAKQTNEVVISISQRRNLITIFKGNIRYVIKESASVLSRANQALQTVEKYKATFDETISTLNEFEFDDVVTLENVIIAIQRAETCMRVVAEVNRYITELGDEGRLIELQLTELTKNLDIEETLLIKDYLRKEATVEETLSKISEYSRSELMDSNNLARLLGYNVETTLEDIEVSPKGYRQLSKIPKTPINIIDNMNKLLGDFQHIIRASIEDLDEVEGIGEIRATYIKNGLIKMERMASLDMQI